MIIKEHEISIFDLDDSFALSFVEGDELYKQSVYFYLEHYVYKKPKCIGVFGAGYFNYEKNKFIVTQYMIEHKGEVKDILYLAKKYFIDISSNKKKKYIVTFSGNNDFTVINYLFNKYGINFEFGNYFRSIDIQKVYEHTFKQSIGLKTLEKKFNIEREGEVMSGSNLAKTFHKVLKDREYFERMPKEKIEKILVYNEQDVVNLFHILVKWNLIVEANEESKENQDN